MKPNRALLTALTAALLAAAAPAAAVAGTGWGPVLQLPGAINATGTDVAVDAAGDQAIALTTYDQQQVLLTTRAAGTSWPAAQAPITTHQTGRAAIGPDGVARTAYVEDGRLYLRSVAPGAVMPSAAEYVAGDPCCDSAVAGSLDYVPQVATGADGATVVTWMANNGSHIEVHWAVRAAGASTFGPIGSTDAGAWILGQAQMASDARGDTVIAWPENVGPYGGDPAFVVRAISRPAGGTFGAPVTVSSPNHHLEPPSVAVGPDGSAALAWRADSDPEGDGVIRGSSRAGAGGAWTSEQDVSNAALDDALPHVAVGGAGGREMAVGYVEDDSRQLPMAALGTAGGTFGAPGQVAMLSARAIDVALGPDGTGILSFYDGSSVWTSIRPRGAAAFAFVDPALATADGQAAQGNASVAFDAQGDALGAWAGQDGAERWRTWDGDPGAAPPSDPAPSVAAAPVSPATPLRTAAAASAATPAARRCAVPNIINLTRTRAAARLRSAHCTLGRVTTPKRYRHRTGLVIRAQSRRSGTRIASGTKVHVTLGVKPKPKHRRR
ncbi:hypothetical protein [Conexibacter woesei]|uniref:hypothetical protein n=1 Tax=Conexibacter woesei TaxID=191495 RepID=UPI0004095CFF|nr:hypothetical protein [Conexibacter woesei]